MRVIEKHNMPESKTYKLVQDIPDALLKTYLSQKEIAVDTELQGLRLGRDQVSLVQLCDRKGNVCLVRPNPPKAPSNLKKLLTHPKVIKIFHFALTDAAFLKASMDIDVHPYHCTKVMSKLIRTYTESHSLKELARELIGMEMIKESQSSNWDSKTLSPAQLEYAANDVLNLLKIYDRLKAMIKDRGKLPSGITVAQLNERSQQTLPTLVDLILNGYGDRDQGWETSVFIH